MNLEILDKLINEGESLLTTISYVPAAPGIIRTFSVYRTSEPDRYQDWQSSTQRFVKTHHPSDLEEVKQASKKLSPDNHRKVLGVLSAIRILPNEPSKQSRTDAPSTNNIHINNTLNSSQQLTLNLFFDAIKDELTGKDLKAIGELLKEYQADPEKRKNKLVEKIKGFGGDVVSNILANILTNPTIYTGIGRSRIFESM